MRLKKPLITIVVAVLNGSKSIERCIKSVISQTYAQRELIVMDGGSTDETIDILQRFTNDIAHWDSGADNGIYDAWNKALKHARGEWVCFLGSDDYFWKDNVLEKLLPHLLAAEKSDTRIVHGRVARVDKEGNAIQFWGKPWTRNRWQMPHGMPIGLPHTGLMHHQGLFKKHGFFDDSFKLAGDYEFLLRELKDKNHQTCFVEDLITVAQQVGGVADSNAYQFHLEVAAARKKNGLPGFSWLWWLVHIRCIVREKCFSNRY